MPVMPKFSLQRGSIILLATYLLISLAPFIPLLLGYSLPWERYIWKTVLMWVLIWAIFSHPAWLHVVTLPAFLILPLDIYLYLNFSQHLDVNHIGIITESSPVESLEFLGNMLWVAIAAYLLIVIWYLFTWKIALRAHDLRMPPKMRVFILFGALAYFLINSHLDKGVTTKDERWKQAVTHVTDMKTIRPFGWLLLTQGVISERYYLSILREQNKNFRFHAAYAGPAQEPRTVVLVLGESANRKHWGAYGYGRDTTPMLAQQKDLVLLQDLISGVTATRLSVPVILTRKDIRTSLRDDLPEKSVIAAFREAGYKTWWLSNQLVSGELDNPITVLANDAEVLRFLNLIGVEDAPAYDEVLLAPFKKALTDPAPRKLIVVHTLGNHWKYSHRYPLPFDKWQPSLKAIGKRNMKDPQFQAHIQNSYDASVLYSDWIFQQMISALSAPQQASVMLFLADHGESVPSQECDNSKMSLHSNNAEDEFRIPGFVWYSPQYQQSFAPKIAQLQKNAKARLSTENIFHTLLELGDIRIPDHNPGRSFVNPAFTPHTRWIDGYGWSDFDKSYPYGVCKEMVEKDSRFERALQRNQKQLKPAATP